MTQQEMFEKSFQRPSNFLHLPHEERNKIDEELGLTDWDLGTLSTSDCQKLFEFYK